MYAQTTPITSERNEMFEYHPNIYVWEIKRRKEAEMCKLKVYDHTSLTLLTILLLLRCTEHYNELCDKYIKNIYNFL